MHLIRLVRTVMYFNWPLRVVSDNYILSKKPVALVLTVVLSNYICSINIIQFMILYKRYEYARMN